MPQQESEWLERARSGDADAFSNLVEIYQGPVYNMCYRMLGNALEAEDAAQETFMRAYNALDRYDPDRKFATWLLSIAANYCIDQHRRRRLTSVTLDAIPQGQLAESAPGVEGQLVRQEASEEVQTLLAELSAQDRAAIVLHYWYDYSYREIANELALSVSAVKSRLHRARRTLAEAWTAQNSSSQLAERRQHETAAF